MDLGTFIDKVIEHGIVAAKADYTRPDEKRSLEGAIRGFEDCRGKSPAELRELLQEANQAASKRMFAEDVTDYWYYRCRALEVEWVCNCVSAILINESQTPLTGFLPTCRGVMKAAEILNLGSRNVRPK